ncbi:hypothetical protein BKA69DRAFT_727197 [Paraphysoderma sedebokerense]|nr:hypothetical protein BKA69DRAFT_727197 [Paraphysoderma sedebokerense]
MERHGKHQSSTFEIAKNNHVETPEFKLKISGNCRSAVVSADANPSSRVLKKGNLGIFTGPESGIYLGCDAEEKKCVVVSEKEKSAQFIPRKSFKSGKDYYYQFQLKIDSEGEEADEDKPLCLNNLGGSFGLGADGMGIIDLYPCTKFRWFVGRNEIFAIKTSPNRVQSMSGRYMMYNDVGKPLKAIMTSDAMLGWQTLWGFTQEL